MNWLNVFRNKYFKFSAAAILYIFWVIWLDNYWFLAGLAVIFDIYVTRKVNWSFWKKRGQKNSAFIEWLDALIFAVIAVTLINIFIFQNYRIPSPSMEKTLLVGDHLAVSKVAYGPRLPITPLTIPFTQNTLPLLGRTYLDWVQWPYKRLAGFDRVKNDDIVVFNFPAGDTVILQNTAASYYSILRDHAFEFRNRDMMEKKRIRSWNEYLDIARDYAWHTYDIVTRPVDRRDNYIKRCIGIPGDSIEVVHGQVFVNGRKQKEIPGLQHHYEVITSGTPINPRALERLGISRDEWRMGQNYTYSLPLTDENRRKIEKFSNVVAIKKNETPDNVYNFQIFPHDPRFPWTLDNFGPLWVPAKGVTIGLNVENLPLYERIIDVCENNDLTLENDRIKINGEYVTSYTFKMNYYFMMGDNRHSSADSRYWGFVPEDHIVGEPLLIWLSIDKNKRFPEKVRWKRILRSAYHEN